MKGCRGFLNFITKNYLTCHKKSMEEHLENLQKQDEKQQTASMSTMTPFSRLATPPPRMQLLVTYKPELL